MKIAGIFEKGQEAKKKWLNVVANQLLLFLSFFLSFPCGLSSFLPLCVGIVSSG